MSYSLAPPPPLPPSRQQLVSLVLSSCVLVVELTDVRGWVEPDHATARKPGPLYNIQNSDQNYPFLVRIQIQKPRGLSSLISARTDSVYPAHNVQKEFNLDLSFHITIIVCKERPSAIWLAVAEPNRAKYRINPEEKWPRAILTSNSREMFLASV
jgi:hypothetical protein